MSESMYCNKCHTVSDRIKSGACRSCNRVAQAKYRLNNPDKIRQMYLARYTKNAEQILSTVSRYRHLNAEKVRAAKARYRAENTEKLRSSKASYYLKNIDKIRAERAIYRANHPEVMAAWRAANTAIIRVHNRNRRARKRNAGGHLSTGIAARLFELQRGKCACGCRQPLGANYHIDHIMPLALGGSNTDENVQLLLAACNQKKHAKHPIVFMQMRGFLL